MTGLLNIPATAYHEDQVVADQPTLSSSIADRLVNQSPRHAWWHHPRLNPNYERKTEDKFDLGTAVHQVLLEGEDAISVCDFPDWRTNAAKDAKAEARAAGLIPLLPKDADRVHAMAAAARAQLAEKNVQPIPFTDGTPEATIVWEENGVTCRARIDWLHDGHRVISDYKSTGSVADPARWDSVMFGIGADIQVAFHSRGLMAVTGALTWPEFRFVVQETYPPYLLSIVSLAPSALKLANAKVERALELWHECLTNDRWPAYPDQVAYIEAPGWAETKWLEREAMVEAA